MQVAARASLAGSRVRPGAPFPGAGSAIPDRLGSLLYEGLVATHQIIAILPLLNGFKFVMIGESDYLFGVCVLEVVELAASVSQAGLFSTRPSPSSATLTSGCEQSDSADPGTLEVSAP